MANKPALNAIRKSFDKKLQRAADLFSAVYVFAEGTWDAINGWEALYPGQARRLVALSFLQVVISWEDFIESFFVRYLMGATSPSGFAPQLRLAAFLPGRSSLFHAYSFAARPPHRCHTNPKPYRTLINQSSQRLQRGCTASPWTRARQKV